MKPKWPSIEGSYIDLSDDDFKEFMKKLGFGRNAHVSSIGSVGYVYIERNGSSSHMRRFASKKERKELIADAVRQCQRLKGKSFVCVTFIENP